MVRGCVLTAAARVRFHPVAFCCESFSLPVSSSAVLFKNKGTKAQKTSLKKRMLVYMMYIFTECHQCLIIVCLFVSFGVIPTSPLPIHTPLMPSQSIDVSLPINTIGPVMKMDPLNNLQVQELSLTYESCKQQQNILKRRTNVSCQWRLLGSL